MKGVWAYDREACEKYFQKKKDTHHLLVYNVPSLKSTTCCTIKAQNLNF